jgi:hypothetical protein
MINIKKISLLFISLFIVVGLSACSLDSKLPSDIGFGESIEPSSIEGNNSEKNIEEENEDEVNKQKEGSEEKEEILCVQSRLQDFLLLCFNLCPPFLLCAAML